MAFLRRMPGTVNNKMGKDITAFIGSTPLLKINNTVGNIYAKLEMFNPLSSVKDRAAFYMVNDAERRGALKPGSIIVEPTSGNTGIALAYIGKLKGYRVILTMPETMSVERRNLLKLLGAELELTPGPLGMKGAIAKAEEILAKTQGSYMPNQFKNPANAQSHFETTGPEIWRDMDGKIDMFIAGVGTGGTITGCGEFLKSKNKNIQIIAVEPSASPVLSGGASLTGDTSRIDNLNFIGSANFTPGMPGPHKIQGIGAGFVPDLLNRSIIDRVIQVSDDDAFEGARILRAKEGLFCGISSGAAFMAARRISSEPGNIGKNIAVVLPDTGERYLSML